MFFQLGQDCRLLWYSFVTLLVLVTSSVALGDDASSAAKLISAAVRGDLESVKSILAEKDVSIDAESETGVSAYQVARIRGHLEVAKFLASKGADVDAKLPSLKSRIEAIVSSGIQKDSPGAAVVVARDGEVIFQNAYGLASIEHRVPVKLETKFRIGSITKQFTATAILLLQEAGKLSVDDPLSNFIDDYPRGDEVTIHHLLTHTSGIRSYTDKGDFFSNVKSYIEPYDLINSFKNDPYDFSPGSGWHYNNSGYFLLGYIVEKVSGKSLAEYLHEHVFEPVEMNNSGLHHWSDILKDEATGYAFTDNRIKKATNWDMSRAGGAGAIYSTVGDLFRWNEALFGGKVLQRKTLSVAFTPVKLEKDVKGPAYGYGWGIGQHRGLKTIGHGGGLNGFRSILTRYPDHNVTIAVLVNASPPPPGLEPTGLSHRIAEQLLWEKMKPIAVAKVDKAVDPKTYGKYVGEYDYRTAIMKVTKKDDRLFAQLTGQAKHEIFPKTETQFFWKVVDAQITFVKNEKGEVVHVVHRQNGNEFKAAKLSGREIAKVDPKVFDVYLGKYNYGGGAVMTVTKDRKRLFAQLTGQPKLEILPSSESEFFWKDVNARVEFVKNDDGEVVKAIHRQGGRKFDAPRID